MSTQSEKQKRAPEIESRKFIRIDCRFCHPGHGAMLIFDRRQDQRDCIRCADRIVSGNVSLTGCIIQREPGNRSRTGAPPFSEHAWSLEHRTPRTIGRAAGLSPAQSAVPRPPSPPSAMRPGIGSHRATKLDAALHCRHARRKAMAAPSARRTRAAAAESCTSAHVAQIVSTFILPKLR